MTGRTSTENAVGMEASLEAGMRHENSAVEAIGRLEAARATLLALRSDALGSKGAKALDYRAAETEYDAAVAAVETALRHSVEREAAKDAAINTFCTHFIFAHDGSSDFSDLRREDFREAVADLARALSPTPPSTGASE